MVSRLRAANLGRSDGSRRRQDSAARADHEFMALDAFLRQRLRSSKAALSTAARPSGARPWLSALFGGLVAWGTAIAGIGVVDLIVRQILLEDLRTNLGRTAAYAASLIDGD